MDVVGCGLSRLTADRCDGTAVGGLVNQLAFVNNSIELRGRWEGAVTVGRDLVIHGQRLVVGPSQAQVVTKVKLSPRPNCA